MKRISDKWARVLIAGSLWSVAVVTQLYWGYHHHYRDFAWRIGLALAIGLVSSILYLWLLGRIVAQRDPTGRAKLWQYLASRHVVLYLAWSYALPLDRISTSFMTDLLLSAGLSSLLRVIYVHCAQSLSERRRFADNFPLIAMTTMLVIRTVKTSLTLSLGLVGALSIIRFRTAIKDPEELAYLFCNIAIGVGLGAQQRGITILGLGLIMAVIYIQHHGRARRIRERGFYLTLESANPRTTSLQAVQTILQDYCHQWYLKRWEQSSESVTMAFILELNAPQALEPLAQQLQACDQHMRITLLDTHSAF